MACYIRRRNYSVVQHTQEVNVQIQDIDCSAWKFKREGRNKCIYIKRQKGGGWGGGGGEMNGNISKCDHSEDYHPAGLSFPMVCMFALPPVLLKSFIIGAVEIVQAFM